MQLKGFEHDVINKYLSINKYKANNMKTIELRKTEWRQFLWLSAKDVEKFPQFVL